MDCVVPYLTNHSAAGAENIHAWLSRHMTGRPTPSVKRPINYMRWATGITIFLGVGTALATASPYILPIIQNRNIWASISLVSVLLFTSGHMFNHIRKVPYIAGDGKGGISYFAGGFQNQFGLETQIVAAICKSMDQERCCFPRANTCRRRAPFFLHDYSRYQGAAHH